MRDYFEKQGDHESLAMMKSNRLNALNATLVDEYKDKPIDGVCKPSAAEYKAGMPESKPSIVKMDKNGNWMLSFNLACELLVK